MRFRSSLCVLVCVSLAGPGAGPRAASARSDAAAPQLRLSLDDQANRLWQDLPEGPTAGDERNVRRLGATPSDCAGEALRRAKAALERGALGRVAVRALEIKLGLDPALLRQHRIASPAELAEMFDAYLESSSEQDFARRLNASDAKAASDLYQHFLRARSDQVQLISPDPACGGVRLLLEIRSLPAEPGRLYASFLAEGHCQCRAPAAAAAGRRLGRWRAAGLARMKPADRTSEGHQIELKWELEEPRYSVLGICGPCPRDETQEASTPAQGPCSRCDPLAQAASEWEQEAARAEEVAARLEPAAAAIAKALGARAAAARQAATDASAAARRCRDRCADRGGTGSRRSEGGAGAKKLAVGAGIAAVVVGGAVALAGSPSDPAPIAAPPTSEPTPQPTLTPTTTTTTTTTPEPPPPPACPDGVFGTYTVRATARGNPCGLASSFSGTLRILGSCSAARFVVNESQGIHDYRGQVEADGSFSGTGGGTLQTRFSFNGTLSGRVTGSSLTADERLTFTEGCPGQLMEYTYAGSR